MAEIRQWKLLLNADERHALYTVLGEIIDDHPRKWPAAILRELHDRLENAPEEGVDEDAGFRVMRNGLLHLRKPTLDEARAYLGGAQQPGTAGELDRWAILDSGGETVFALPPRRPGRSTKR